MRSKGSPRFIEKAGGDFCILAPWLSQTLRACVLFLQYSEAKRHLRSLRLRALTKPTTARIALIYKKSEAILASGGGFAEPFGIVKSSRPWRQILPQAKFPRQLHLHPAVTYVHVSSLGCKFASLGWICRALRDRQIQSPSATNFAAGKISLLAGFLNALPVC